MYAIQNIVEYYDELFPVTTAQKKFYDQLVKNYSVPVKFLRVGCGTGVFESILAREGYDVTGIEQHKELIHSANMRRRSQLMAIRFFQMSYWDMSRFLGKGFYNIVSVLDDRLSFVSDKVLLKGFFKDVYNLLSDNGCFVISLLNYSIMQQKPMQKLPERRSVRARLYSEMWAKSPSGALCTKPSGDVNYFLTQNLETGNGRMLPVMEDEPIYPVSKDEIEDLAFSAGFSSADFYSDFSNTSFTGNEERLVALIRK